MTLSEKARKKLTDPNVGFLATVQEDGSPQVTPVWVDVDADHVLVNSVLGRRKELNVRRDPRVALSVAEQDDPYDHVDIRGRVVDFVVGDEAERHIDALAKKYMGRDIYPNHRADEQRVILRIKPEHVLERGV